MSRHPQGSDIGFRLTLAIAAGGLALSGVAIAGAARISLSSDPQVGRSPSVLAEHQEPEPIFGDLFADHHGEHEDSEHAHGE